MIVYLLVDIPAGFKALNSVSIDISLHACTAASICGNIVLKLCEVTSYILYFSCSLDCLSRGLCKQRRAADKLSAALQTETTFIGLNAT